MFLDSGKKTECFGCEACAQICSVLAITMVEDDEGFCYPIIDCDKCIKCGQCRNVCPHNHVPEYQKDDKYVFGGYHKDEMTRFESTSGGAFSAIVDAFCDTNYVIFGAEAKGLLVAHSFITDKREVTKFRKSKYSQSRIGSSYKKTKRFLQEGKKVLFSGTPCQIAGLLAYLGNTNQDNLLTIEVVCEGVPSPLYTRKYNDAVKRKHGAEIDHLDFRYTGNSILNHGKWDFEVMRADLNNNLDNPITLKKDRWFNPFWSVWLKHLMSRPSCYECPFARQERVADITLGDLWGVHLYCPELYGKNGGASLIICNSSKGKAVFTKAQENMYGHELAFSDALKYQGPMRNHIAYNDDRDAFMKDLKSSMTYKEINNKWADKPSIKLLFSKYIWGNRQKIWLWNLKKPAKRLKQND